MRQLTKAVASLSVAQTNDEFIDDLAKDIHTCFEQGFLNWGHNESGAIKSVQKAWDMGKWSELNVTFHNKYGAYLEDWLPKQLDARRDGAGLYKRSVAKCEVSEYARVFYPEEVVKDAHTFYRRCWGTTDNEELATFIDQLAGYSGGKVTGEGAKKLVNMMCCYGECFWWHNPGENKNPFKYPEGISDKQKQRIDRFSAVLQYELEETGNLAATRKVIQLAIDEYAAGLGGTEKAPAKAEPGEAKPKEEDNRGLPIPKSSLPPSLNDLVLPGAKRELA